MYRYLVQDSQRTLQRTSWNIENCCFASGCCWRNEAQAKDAPVHLGWHGWVPRSRFPRTTFPRGLRTNYFLRYIIALCYQTSFCLRYWNDRRTWRSCICRSEWTMPPRSQEGYRVPYECCYKGEERQTYLTLPRQRQRSRSPRQDHEASIQLRWWSNPTTDRLLAPELATHPWYGRS